MVPKIINNLFKQEGIKRNTRIHFPDGERPDICNSNIESNSINIENPLCSSDELKFGLCESSIFECNVVNIENKNIPTKTASGTNIHLTDSVKAPLAEIVIDGNTVEKGTGTKSPENPYTFASVGEGGSVTVTACGKNLALLDQSVNTDARYFNFEYNTQEHIKATSNDIANKFFAALKARLEKGQEYTITINANKEIGIYIYSDKLWGTKVTSFKCTKSYTFVFEGETGDYIIGLFNFVNITPGTTVEVSNIQIEKGSTSTPYEPYKSQSITIPLSEPLRSVGEVKDTIERQNGIYGIVRRTSKIVLDGTEKWGKVGAPNDTFYCTTFDTERLPIDSKSICNFTDSHGAAGTSSGYQIHEFVEKTEVYINFGSDIMTTNTVDFFKQYLAEHNVTIIYATKESVFEPFPDYIQSLFATTITFNGMTNITATDNANMSIRYQCNDMALGQEIIKNPYPDRGNIKGCKIEVFSEIDVSSLTEEEIAEYGQTAEDVPFPFYRVPRFAGTVYSCKKQSNMDMRKIVAYDALNSDNLDRNMLGWIRKRNFEYPDDFKLRQSFTGADTNYMTDYFKKKYSVYSDNICDFVNSMLYNLEIQSNIRKEKTSIQLYDFHEATCKDYDPNTPTGHTNINNFLAKPIKVDFSVGCVVENSGTEIYIPKNVFKIDIEYDMDAVEKFNNFANKACGDTYSVEERLKSLKTLPAVFYSSHKKSGTSQGGYYYDHYLCAVKTGEYIQGIGSNDKYKLGYFGFIGSRYILNSYKGFGLYRGVDNPGFNIVKSIKLTEYEDYDKSLFVNDDVPIKIEYYKENDNTNVDTDKLTGRNIISSILEMNGLFGKIDESGLFTLRKLGKPYWQLSNAWQLSGAWVLNYSTECRIPQGEEESAWYDEDYESSLYGAVKISGDNNTLICKYIGNPGGLKTYNITNNLLLCNGLYSQTEMYEILKNMFARIQSVRFTPMMISCKSLPDRETGDKVIISDDGKEISTYIFNKVTSGIMALMDEIDNTNMN